MPSDPASDTPADAPTDAPVLREATPLDLPDILRLVRLHADFEGAPDAARASESDLHRALFPERGDPALHALLVQVQGRVVGQALWFRTFSTWTGRPGLWLDDFYLEREVRGRGIGTAVMRHLAALTLANGWTRFEWTVSSGNDGGIEFYRGLGARPLADQTLTRLDGPALEACAAGVS